MPPDHVYNVVPYGHSLEIARIMIMGGLALFKKAVVGAWQPNCVKRMDGLLDERRSACKHEDTMRVASCSTKRISHNPNPSLLRNVLFGWSTIWRSPLALCMVGSTMSNIYIAKAKSTHTILYSA